MPNSTMAIVANARIDGWVGVFISLEFFVIQMNGVDAGDPMLFRNNSYPCCHSDANLKKKSKCDTKSGGFILR